ncbi:serine dehydratase beta chain, partial [Peribacillus frigoritolerans]
MKYRSAFDIIGPVMIGPSSSHTAGAARIGRVARTLFGKQPKKAIISLYGSFAKTYRGHGTDVAVVGGILDFDTDDE